MPTVLHIDGLSAEPEPFFAIEEGETLGQVLKRMGATVRMEQVPDKPRSPRELARDVRDFIASYQPEDPASVLAVVRRYGWLDAEEFDTVAEAESYIESGEDWGSLAGEAIVSGEQVTVWD